MKTTATHPIVQPTTTTLSAANLCRTPAKAGAAVLALSLLTLIHPRTASAAEGDPTPEEQYFVELINRARANPEAEAKRYGITLNEGSPVPAIAAGSRAPLALNPKVLLAARNHLCWMNSGHGAFAHSASGTIGEHCFTGAETSDRLAYVDQGHAGWSENLGLTGQQAGEAAVEQLHELLFVDAMVPGRGHRVNILNDFMNEVGAAIGDASRLGFQGIKTGVVQKFIKSPDAGARLTGVVIDDKNGDQFYAIGEGMGDVAVEIVGTDLRSKTWPSGGYTLAIGSLAAGEHTVRFTRNGKVFDQNFTLAGDRNIKVDALANAFGDPPPRIFGRLIPRRLIC